MEPQTERPAGTPSEQASSTVSASLPAEVPADVLARAVRGRNLAGPTLAENLVPSPTLLCFLRHFG